MIEKYVRVQLWVRAHSPYYDKAQEYDGNTLFKYLHQTHPDIDPLSEALWMFNIKIQERPNHDGTVLTKDDIQYVILSNI
jgi:hypothetical protein